MQISRVLLAAAAGALPTPFAATMASRNGNATAVPKAPRRKVRRSICFPVMKCITILLRGLSSARLRCIGRCCFRFHTPHPERVALHDPQDERRNLVVVRFRVLGNRADAGLVEVL